MSSRSEKNPFMLVLAGISLLADVLTLVQFIFSGNIFEFWTFRWTISIVFVFGFFWAGVGLLRLGQSPENADLAMAVFGTGYLISSLVVYSFMCIFQTVDALSWTDYLGFGVLLAVSYYFGNLALGIIGNKSQKYLSYGYGLASLVFAISLVIKYVFSGYYFDWEVFVGEIILLIVGAAIFIRLYVTGDKN